MSLASDRRSPGGRCLRALRVAEGARPVSRRDARRARLRGCWPRPATRCSSSARPATRRCRSPCSTTERTSARTRPRARRRAAPGAPRRRRRAPGRRPARDPRRAPRARRGRRVPAPRSRSPARIRGRSSPSSSDASRQASSRSRRQPLDARAAGGLLADVDTPERSRRSSGPGTPSSSAGRHARRPHPRARGARPSGHVHRPAARDLAAASPRCRRLPRRRVALGRAGRAVEERGPLDLAVCWIHTDAPAAPRARGDALRRAGGSSRCSARGLAAARRPAHVAYRQVLARLGATAAG